MQKNKKESAISFLMLILLSPFISVSVFVKLGSTVHSGDSFEQVGCIHSTQGLEFEYVGVIIGLDMRYENGHVITDRTKRAKSDATIKGLKGNEQLGDKIIRDTYKTLLSRGQKGCFIYCEDEKLGEYIKEALQKAKKNL